MTDQEYEKLKQEYESTKALREITVRDTTTGLQELYNRESSLEKKIKDERMRRLTETGMDAYKASVQDFFVKKIENGPRLTDQLWMVEIGGKKFRSSKGKYTWTSEGRAEAAVCNYIYYDGPYDLRQLITQGKLDIGSVVEELIKEGYIKIIRIV